MFAYAGGTLSFVPASTWAAGSEADSIACGESGTLPVEIRTASGFLSRPSEKNWRPSGFSGMRSGNEAKPSSFSAMPDTDSSVASARADSAVVAYLESVYDVKFTGNNRLVFFTNGQDKFDDLFEAVRQARHTIHLEYFNFRNDSISHELFSLLIQKAAEGVKVRALFDGFGNSSNNRPLRRVHLDSLRASGIEIYEFDPMRFPWINHALHRDHRKIVVIDGLVAYTGSMNVADYYIHGKPEFGDWRDVHMRIEGQAVGSLQAVFVGFWNRVTGQDLKGPELYPGGRDARLYFKDLRPDTTSTAGKKLLGIVDKGPGSPKRIIKDTFVKVIDEARQQIQLINPYFTLSPRVRRALKRAVRRGVDVQIMVSAKSDIPITPRIVERNAKRMMKAGAEVWIYEGGFHHSKIMMVDSAMSFVGSANLNARSLTFDYECNVLIADSFSTRQLQSVFERDKRSHCVLLTPERWEQLPRWQRFKGWLFQIFTPFCQNARPKDARRANLGLVPELAPDFM